LTTSLGKKNLILHVSTMPTLDGERIVVKIHDQSPKTADLKELGLWGKSLSDLKHAIVQPHGMIIVTGPVRSGKSTTLLSILNTLSLPGNSIATIEDPIKYRINSATQVQVNENLGVSYSSGLAALLGQNSNIIMVGDLVDLTTARLAILAASSGRLLLTTLPAYSAARGLELLANMGVEPYLTASTTRVIVSQRLLRRLCPICRESFVPSKSNLSYIATAFNIAAVGGMERINQLESEALNENVGRAAQASSNLSSEPDTINRLWRARRYGCDNCDHSGYKGLTAIYEVMPLTRDIQAQVASNKSGSAINDMVINQGMVPLQIDALIKALRGETTIEEILRVLAHGPARRQALA
jgi:type II secretory ATPase GspE/PulE/Tfp pilus assembly ATPase PilB-like protein